MTRIPRLLLRWTVSAIVGGLLIPVVYAQEVIEGTGLDIEYVEPTPEKSSQKAAAFWSKIKWSGYLKNETAYRFREPRSITKIRNIAYVDLEYPFSRRSTVKMAGWAYYDLAYDLFDYDTISARSVRNEEEPLVFVERLAEEKDSPVAEIRELYVDTFFDKADLRIGKQFIIWGVLEGIRVVDEINPMDFRELILPDLLDYRIPLWSVKYDYYADNATVEFIWIPDLRFHKPAPRGSEWELLQDVCVGQSEEILCIENEPDSFTFKDSEYGVKLDTTWKDIELSFSFFSTWDDFPVIFRTVSIDDNTIPPKFFPTRTRINMYGMTAVRQLDRFILKGEVAYVTDKYFGTKNTTDRNDDGFLDNDGELQRDHIRWGFGFEFNKWGMDIAPGVTQWIILDYDDALMQDRFDSSLNLFTRKEFPQQSAVFQMLAIYLVNLREVFIKPKVTFQISDRLQLGTGVDLFFGEKSDFGANDAAASNSIAFDPGVARAQFVGNFHDNDRAFIEFRYSF